jgi:hypothetical protein
MKILELFAGSRSIWKEWELLWNEVFSSDITQFWNIHYVVDILEFDISQLPFKPDIIWASPPCQWFSVAAIGRNWNIDWTPKTDSARLWIRLLEKTLSIIRDINPTYFFIENPRGKMRKMKQLDWIQRHTVTYCQYWDSRMKPTDIWTNNDNWKPRKMCKNWDPCHISAPRWSKTWTQWLKWDYERSKIPEQLCKEIILSCM